MVGAIGNHSFWKMRPSANRRGKISRLHLTVGRIVIATFGRSCNSCPPPSARKPRFSINPAFTRRMQRSKQLERYRFYQGKYLLTLNGAEYFNSNQDVDCPSPA